VFGQKSAHILQQEWEKKCLQETISMLAQSRAAKQLAKGKGKSTPVEMIPRPTCDHIFEQMVPEMYASDDSFGGGSEEDEEDVRLREAYQNREASDSDAEGW
jgi:hypothetical protein